jgi:hypothetical protein
MYKNIFHFQQKFAQKKVTTKFKLSTEIIDR